MRDNFLSRSFPLKLTRGNPYSGYATHDPTQGRCHTTDHCCSLHRSLFRFLSEFPMHNHFRVASPCIESPNTYYTTNVQPIADNISSTSALKPVSVCSLLTDQAAVRSHKTLPRVSQGYFRRNLTRAWTKPLQWLRHASPAQSRYHSSNHCSLNRISSGPERISSANLFQVVSRPELNLLNHNMRQVQAIACEISRTPALTRLTIHRPRNVLLSLTKLLSAATRVVCRPYEVIVATHLPRINHRTHAQVSEILRENHDHSQCHTDSPVSACSHSYSPGGMFSNHSPGC